MYAPLSRNVFWIYGALQIIIIIIFFYCALQYDLGQGALTGDVVIPSVFPSLDRGKEWFLPASVVGDLSVELTLPVLCVRDAHESSVARVLECLHYYLQIGCVGPTFAPL